MQVHTSPAVNSASIGGVLHNTLSNCFNALSTQSQVLQIHSLEKIVYKGAWTHSYTSMLHLFYMHIETHWSV